MKSRRLNTVSDIVIRDYTITLLQSGKFLHSFSPKNTNTKYEFKGNNIPIVKNGSHYNLGYTIEEGGVHMVEPSSISKTSEVNPIYSYLFAQQIATENFKIEKEKNNIRVSPNKKGKHYYWGKKYAWRIFGTVISKNAFYSYLEEIKHPIIHCVVKNPNIKYETRSIAYREKGLQKAIEKLIFTSKRISKAYFTSPLYSKKISIRGIKAITDKK